MSDDVKQPDDPYLAAATAVMDAVALTPLHGLCRDGRMLTLDDAGLPADVSMGWADGTREILSRVIEAADVSHFQVVSELVTAARRYRDAARAFGGDNRPGADYAALLRERDAASAAIIRWADRHAPATVPGGVR